MPAAQNAPAPRDAEEEPTAEELLNDAVLETSDRAGGKDEDEVEADLRAAMGARGLEPGDTTSLAEDIARSSDRPA